MERDLEKKFQDVYIGAAENWKFVQALRGCFEVSLPNIGDALISYLDRSVRETMGKPSPNTLIRPRTPWFCKTWRKTRSLDHALQP
jgi:hypothetical protein